MLGYRVKLDKEKEKKEASRSISSNIGQKIATGGHLMPNKPEKAVVQQSYKPSLTAPFSKQPRNKSLSQGPKNVKLAPISNPVELKPAAPVGIGQSKMRLKSFASTLPEIKKPVLSRAKTGAFIGSSNEGLSTPSTSCSVEPILKRKAKTFISKSKLKAKALVPCDEICEDKSSSDDDREDSQPDKQSLKLQRKQTIGKNCTTFNQWKQRNDIALTQKVSIFSLLGFYCLERA